jgi:hypothetical protein
MCICVCVCVYLGLKKYQNSKNTEKYIYLYNDRYILILFDYDCGEEEFRLLIKIRKVLIFFEMKKITGFKKRQRKRRGRESVNTWQRRV